MSREIEIEKLISNYNQRLQQLKKQRDIDSKDSKYIRETAHIETEINKLQVELSNLREKADPQKKPVDTLYLSREAQIEELLTNYNHRLQKLQRHKLWRQSFNIGAHITLEIEDIELEIEQLQSELTELQVLRKPPDLSYEINIIKTLMLNYNHRLHELKEQQILLELETETDPSLTLIIKNIELEIKNLQKDLSLLRDTDTVVPSFSFEDNLNALLTYYENRLHRLRRQQTLLGTDLKFDTAEEISQTKDKIHRLSIELARLQSETSQLEARAKKSLPSGLEVHLKKLIVNYSERLHQLKKQRAFFGLETEFAILLEIEDIETILYELQSQMVGLRQQDSLNNLNIRSSVVLPVTDDVAAQLKHHQERLYKLLEQQSLEGMDIDPRILIEIEDLEEEIESLQKALAEPEFEVVKKTPASPEDKLRDKIVYHLRVLQKLKERSALQGVDAKPERINEIINLEMEIQSLQSTLKDQTGATVELPALQRKNNLMTLTTNNLRYLQKLKEHDAIMGLDVDPAIKLKIVDIEEKTEKLKREVINVLEEGLEQPFLPVEATVYSVVQRAEDLITNHHRRLVLLEKKRTLYGNRLLFKTYAQIDYIKAEIKRLLEKAEEVAEIETSPRPIVDATTIRIADKYREAFELQHTLLGHQGKVNQLVWSSGGQKLASASDDNSIWLWNATRGEPDEQLAVPLSEDIWDLEDDRPLRSALNGCYDGICSLAWSSDLKFLASGSYDGALRIWDTEAGQLFHTIEGHTDIVSDMTWSPDAKKLATVSLDQTIHLWRITDEGVHKILELFSLGNNVVWSPDGSEIVSSIDDTVYIWDAVTGELREGLVGHSAPISCLAWSPDGQIVVSGSSDNNIRLWEAKTGTEVRLLQGHTDAIISLSFSADGSILASMSYSGIVNFWRTDTWQMMTVFEEWSLDNQNSFARLLFHPTDPTIFAATGDHNSICIWNVDPEALYSIPTIPPVHYINAKVVLVGDSGVGKTALGIRMAEDLFRPTSSTHGAYFWQISVSRRRVRAMNLSDHKLTDVQAELTLWDLAGQAEYRLTHQLFLDDVDVALLLYDCSNPVDPFRGIHYWAKALKKHAPSHARKYLVASRVNVSPVTVDRHQIWEVLAKYGLQADTKTSAETGHGVKELLRQIIKEIAWDKLPRTTAPQVFHAIRQYLLEKKSEGITLIDIADIQQQVYEPHAEREATQDEIDTVISLLQSKGIIRNFQTEKHQWVLLRPEVIHQYAASIIQAARNHPQGIGAIPESAILDGAFEKTNITDRLSHFEEPFLLKEVVELFIDREICFREMGMLVFPSHINVLRPVSQKTLPRFEVTYHFSGSVDAIYATLVVRLSHTKQFKRLSLWKNSVEFSRGDGRLGIFSREIEEGTNALDIYFDSKVSALDRHTFNQFVIDHLENKGVDIQEYIRLYCSKCGKEIIDQEAIETLVKAGETDIPCQYCKTVITIPRNIGEKYQSELVYSQQQQDLTMIAQSQTQKELIAFQKDHEKYITSRDHRLRILHLSDLHIETMIQVNQLEAQLRADLNVELSVKRLDYLVISGDIASHSTPDEYEAAFEFVNRLAKGFKLEPNRIVIVPGNHDLNWELSGRAYEFVYRNELTTAPQEGKFIDAGKPGVLICNEELNRQRFVNFDEHLFNKIYNKPYPLDYSKQSFLTIRADDRILFLTFNSSWNVDRHFPARASINPDALAHAFGQLVGGDYDDWLKIAVWHHPISGPSTMNSDFLEQLAVHGFQLCLHGHIQQPNQVYHKYDEQRGMYLIGAGTFGIPTKKGLSSIPLSYNLLIIDPETNILTVETRKKEKPDGVWMADARWGNKNEPKPRYEIPLKREA